MVGLMDVEELVRAHLDDRGPPPETADGDEDPDGEEPILIIWADGSLAARSRGVLILVWAVLLSAMTFALLFAIVAALATRLTGASFGDTFALLCLCGAVCGVLTFLPLGRWWSALAGRFGRWSR